MMVSSFILNFAKLSLNSLILFIVFMLLLLIVRYNHYSCVFFCVGLVCLHIYMMVAVLGIVGVVDILVVEVEEDILVVEVEVGILVDILVVVDILVMDILVVVVGNLVMDILVEDTLVDNLVEVFLDLVVVRCVKRMKNGCNYPGVHPQSYPQRCRFRP